MILIDGSMLAMRCITKMDFLKTSTDIPSGLEYGFLRSVESLQSRLNDEHVIVVWDGGNMVRQKLCKDYKANRPPRADGIWDRINAFKHTCKYIYDSVWLAGYEADDILYSIAEQTVNTSQTVYLVTNDKDLLGACYFGHVRVVRSHDSQIFLWDAEKVKEKYSVPPRLLKYYLAYVGDAVDNIKGVPYISKQLCANIICWCFDNGLIDSLHAEMCTGDFQDKVLKSLSTFDFDLNLKLVTPISLTDPYTMHIQPHKGTNCSIVKEFLLKYEIRTLKICKQYNIETLKDAEL